MQKKNPNDKAVSLKFIIAVSAVITALIFYISYPDGTDGEKGKKSFSEQLEYNSSPQTAGVNAVQNYTKKRNKNSSSYEQTAGETAADAPKTPKALTPYSRQKVYNQILDELAEYPSQSEFTTITAVKKLLAFKGYPENILKVSFSNTGKKTVQTSDSYMFADFDFLTGTLCISRNLLRAFDTNTVLAVLAHELDYFDKLAKIRKIAGAEEFANIFAGSGAGRLDEKFWESAAFYAETDNFIFDLYTNGLKKHLSESSLDTPNFYGYFYRLSENTLNPLEISAYKESDYVYKHFNMPAAKNDAERISDIFSTIDSNLDRLLMNLDIQRHEKAAFFEYFFMEAIAENMPEFKQEYARCIENKNGDLSSFRQKFKSKNEELYKRGIITRQTLEDILKILNSVNEKVQQGLTPVKTAEVLQYKFNTLKSGLESGGAEQDLRITALDYLKYIKNKNIENPGQELNAILAVICIDNQLYKNTSDKEISLYDLELADELVNLYGNGNMNKKRRFVFVYNNPAFQAENFQDENNEGRNFIELLNRSRLDIKFQE